MDQTVLDASRGYNGWAGSGDTNYPKLGTFLQEFTVPIDPTTGLLIVTDLGDHGTIANWAEVPGVDRKQGACATQGDNCHYVENVKAAPTAP